MQVALPPGPHDAADSMVLAVADRDVVWSLWQASIGESQGRLRLLEKSPATLHR